MRRNVAGIELSETKYIDQAGTYRFKIEKVEIDGYDDNGDEIPKLTFSANKIEMQDGKPVLNEDVKYTFQDKYSGNQNMLWKSKMLQVGLKAPECFDFEDLVGYYLIANIKMNKEKNGDRLFANVAEFKYSKANDGMKPIPDYANVPVTETVPVNNEVELEIDNSEIPF